MPVVNNGLQHQQEVRMEEVRCQHLVCQYCLPLIGGGEVAHPIGDGSVVWLVLLALWLEASNCREVAKKLLRSR